MEGVVLDTLPGTLTEAVGFMKADSFIEEILGKNFVHTYTEAKMNEWNDYMNQVSDWEINKYLNRI